MAHRWWSPHVNAFELAAIQVLRRSKQPLTVREITERMIEQGLVSPAGKTPERSLYTIILRSNRRAEKAGRRPGFRVHRGLGKTIKYSLDKTRP